MWRCDGYTITQSDVSLPGYHWPLSPTEFVLPLIEAAAVESLAAAEGTGVLVVQRSWAVAVVGPVVVVWGQGSEEEEEVVRPRPVAACSCSSSCGGGPWVWDRPEGGARRGCGLGGGGCGGG